jgi:1A family penicillin-binding protein
MHIPERNRAQLRRIFGLYAQHPRIVTGVVLGCAAVVLGVIVWGVLFTYNIACTLPGRDALRSAGHMAQATTLYDDADRPVFTIYREQRIEVPLSKMSPHLVDAIVAIEDQRFFEHHGFDLTRIAGAALANLRHQRAAQGGSTITQQLARQSFLTPDKTLRRKVAELMLAARLERMYSKRRILEMYLNRVYFGDGFYGAEAASLGFFGKHASDLDVAEAALLAGLVKSPSSYAPTISRSRAVARRNVVLQAMRETGKIDEAQWQQSRAEPLALHDALEANDTGFGGYFKEQVRRELVSRFGWERVYEGGLRVYTTFDPAMQRAAEAAVQETLKDLDERRAAAAKRAKRPLPGEPLQAALVAIEPGSGAVRAMVGGRDFDDSSFNRAVQARRQPGSAFKPFIYAEALESGFTPATLIDHLDDPVLTAQGAWSPEDEHLDTTAVTLRTGLRTSSNRAAVQLLQEVGIDKTIRYAKSVGISGLPEVPSLALGSGDVTLLSLATAYVPFADEGISHRSYLVRRVADRNGNVIFSVSDEASRVLSETSAFLMAQMLADVVDGGTAYRVRALGFTLPAAGKTGTTNGYNDAWFVGFTPSVLAGVWVGYDQPHTIMRNGYAGDVAVPMWTRFMKRATAGAKAQWYAVPANVVSMRVCRMSGKLAVDGCEHVPVVTKSGDVQLRSMVYDEYFLRGTEPTETCDLHGGPSLLNRLVGIFGGGSAQQPVPLSSLGPPPAPRPSSSAIEPTAGRQARASGEPEQPKKKRGFWSKLLGLGKKEQEQKKQDEKK